MSIQKFEDIIAWQKGQQLAAQIYNLFKASHDFGFKDQITRAAVSISNNIAEGFERGSNADFIRFLYMSLGSCSEVKSMSYLAEKLEYFSLSVRDDIITQTTEINKIIYGLINSMNKK
jgi:four helix bundle protein